MRGGSAIAAACVALSLLGISSSARADIFNFNGSTGDITFSKTAGGTLDITSGALTGFGGLSTSSVQGTYTLGALNITTGVENASLVFPVMTGATETLSVTGPGGTDTLSGMITWSFVTGNSNIPEFVGLFTGTGTGAYAAFSVPGLSVDLEANNIGIGKSLGGLAPGGSFTQPASGGEITTTNGVPGPLMGAGLPGIVAACGGLFLLARRRRRQAIA